MRRIKNEREQPRQFRFVKKAAVSAVYLSLVISFGAGCGGDKPEVLIEDVEYAGIGVNDEPETPTEAGGLSSDADDSGDFIPIVWDFFWAYGARTTIYPSRSNVALALNERFNIEIDSLRYTGRDLYEHAKTLAKSGGLPDIFTSVFADIDYMIEEGALKEIPWDMVKRYAPRYYAMLGQNQGLLEVFTDPSYEMMKYIFPAIEIKEEELSVLSVYRLDWLEAVGAPMKGEHVKIDERIYFTDQAYDFYELEMILKLFTELIEFDKAKYTRDGYEARGMVVDGTFRDWYSDYAFLGMFGLSVSNMENGGSAVTWLASEEFRQYITCLSELIKSGSCHVEEAIGSLNYKWNGLVGRWSSDLRYIFGEHGLAETVLPNMPKTEPEAKFLITPPEIGPGGKQGAEGFYSNTSVTTAFPNFLIRSDVSDEKLARILQVFDAISFDPELYVMTKYGFEGVDFEWLGEPYDSGVRVNSDSRECSNHFVSNVRDGNAGKKIYDYPSDVVYKYITGDRAVAMILYPFKSDPEGTTSEAYNQLVSLHPFDLNDQSGARNSSSISGIAEDFYRAVIKGEKDPAGDWDAYINELNAAGLAEWNALYDSFPVTN